ncbi:bile acid:sodium symporter family protein [Allosphingosinicella indica]|uniref:Bile acid:Na+ symporter, BASS family n=1 Tax=Allosphingosinicella indica TaxID=941907 RepID=A0A1X7H1C5_9SPHN|nr:bile acid:sodium symporter family protein [Allosphingosinicella indica]SMF78143.1 bile acid:Na+ symporter, BASS family [Allosphingosinicella indica]
MPPETIEFVNTVFVPVGLMLIMFSMGLTLALKDFGLVLGNGRAVGAGLFGQLLVMPLLALAIGIVFRLPPELALGVFILGITPAGTTSNALTFVGKGNVALAVVLTALSSLITVFSIPILLSWALPHFLGDGGGTVPELSIPTTILQLLRITILPMAVGMLVHRLAPGFASRMAHWLRPTSFIVLIGVIVFAVVVSLDMVLANLIQAGPPLWVLNVLAMGTGLLLARLIGVGGRDSMTLAIEVGVHNVTLATFLTLTVLNSLPLAVTQNIYGVVMLVNAMILIRWFRARTAA